MLGPQKLNAVGIFLGCTEAPVQKDFPFDKLQPAAQLAPQTQVPLPRYSEKYGLPLKVPKN